MRSQATRINPHREEQLEIVGCGLFLLLYLGILLVLYSFPWHVFG
ncbi:hypothetical protein NGA35_04265 [Pseudomonas stutzeri]|nr:hypothetical protein [Stutzerimonas stutzeri]